jgi:hypothetical protein
MPDWEALLAYWPGWVSLVVAAILTFNKLVEESYRFASIWGNWGKAMHAKALARHHVDLAAEQFATAVKNAVELARDEWESEDSEAIAALDARLKTVSQVTGEQVVHIRELLEQDRIKSAYLDYEGIWHNRFRVAAARSSDGRLSLDELPGHLGYYDFEAAFRENPKWREWSDL